ncbi:MAG TPA: Stp1/IreP family PP2C-type Ser/Thr phosphatase [Candidatus Acidoferrum sp.]|nr:Stp1/IreP family PP2C-type Ser/Thr phosphatase [Candidatus Acidoferrum sp.]
MEFAAITDTGRVRGNNEDCFGVAEEIELFVLSDGMGGYASGEVASKIAVNSVLDHVRASEKNASLPLLGTPHPGASSVAQRLASAVAIANQAIRDEAEKNSARRGMGATIVAMQFHEQRVSIAHVGDSRAYRLRNGTLEQLTDDHSFVADQVRRGKMTQAEAETSKFQNVLMRALGPEPEVIVDISEEVVLDGDTFLLCSDGLSKELRSTQIGATLGRTDGTEEIATRLIQMANDAGGEDNITVVIVRFAPKLVGALVQKLGRWFRES